VFIIMLLVHKYFSLGLILFLIGLSGIVLNRRNLLLMLMSIELMLLAVNMNLIAFSVSLDDIMGQLFAILVLTVAAAESAIGLAILLLYYRLRGSISVEKLHFLRG
jgi:NADH-quinone oxidoreductase subunit K